MVTHYLNLLTDAVSDRPTIEDLRLTADDESRQLELWAWACGAHTRADLTSRLFAAQAASRPDADGARLRHRTDDYAGLDRPQQRPWPWPLRAAG